MKDTGDVEDASLEEAERVSANAEVHANAWQETLEEMWALEEQYQEQGWETVETAAGHTNPLAPSDSRNRWGLEHIVPDSDAEAIEDVVGDADFTSYDVYRKTVDGRVFSVTVLLDPDVETAVLIANQFALRHAVALVEHVKEVGHVDTVVRYLDGTVVARVRHEKPEKFFPRYEEFETFGSQWDGVGSVAGEE